MPTVNIYIDGFNLYYGALRNRWPQYKWLDLQGFCERLLPWTRGQAHPLFHGAG